MAVRHQPEHAVPERQAPPLGDAGKVLGGAFILNDWNAGQPESLGGLLHRDDSRYRSWNAKSPCRVR
jgi:hypothetical protein